MKATKRSDASVKTKAGPRRSRRMRGAITAVAAASAIALGGALVAPPQEARADLIDDALGGAGSLQTLISQLAVGADSVLGPVGEQWRLQVCAAEGVTRGGADCSLSSNVGVAVVAPGNIELVPRVLFDPAQELANHPILGLLIPDIADAAEPFGSARVIGDGIKFALASTGGNATAIAFLPLSLATAGASNGRTSVAFAVLGIANAWNTDKITTSLLGITTPLSIPPIKRLDCLGVLAGAYAEGVGACGNVLGTLDGRILTDGRTIPELQMGLTNPLAMLEVISDPGGTLTDLVTGLLTGASLQDLLTSDFARLTIGGDRNGAQIGSIQLPNLVALTSHYGFINPIKVSWLGQELTIFPTTGAINGKTTPNYLALPQLGGTFDPSQIMPSVTGLSMDNINLGLLDLLGAGSNPLGNLGGLLGGSNPLGGLLGGSNPLGGLLGGGLAGGLLGGLTDSLGLNAIVPLADPAIPMVQRAATNIAVANQLGVEDTSSASTLAGAGVAPATINKLVAATSPAPATQSAAAKSATPSVKAGDAVKNWQSGAKQSWQGTTDKWQQTQQTWKANQQQRTQSWQQKQQSWTPSWKRPEGAAGQPSQQGAGVAGQNNWSGTSRPQSPFSSGTKPSFGGWGGKSATPSGAGATGATSGGGSN